MGFFDFFKKRNEITDDDTQTAEYLFSEDEDTSNAFDCDNCVFKDKCLNVRKDDIDLCRWIIDLDDSFDINKETILIIDDNAGMVSFLYDDLDYISSIGIFDEDEYNILSLSGAHAAFNLKALLTSMNGLNIKYAIIDITLGGSSMFNNKNVKYTGVDVFEMLYEYNKNLKFLFYTGNNLNPYIKSNAKLIDQFKMLTNKDIKDYVLFKTSMDMDNRREYIINHIFNI